jgi:hypothetical protein
MRMQVNVAEGEWLLVQPLRAAREEAQGMREALRHCRVSG